MTLVVEYSFKKLGGLIVRPANVLCKKYTFVNRLQLMNAFAPIVVTDDGIIMEDKLEQDWNAPVQIDVTELGIVTEVKPEQPENVPLIPIFVSPYDNITEVRPIQPWNANGSIDVTELGIVSEGRLVQFWNAL